MEVLENKNFPNLDFFLINKIATNFKNLESYLKESSKQNKVLQKYFTYTK